MAKIILSQGHGGADAGSKGQDGKWEKDRIREIVPDLRKKLEPYGHEVIVRNEKNTGGAFAFTALSGDLKLSFHFNAFDGSAKGVEVLYKKSGRKDDAARLSKQLAEAMGIRNRGSKYRGDLYMMNIGFDLLVEICFHDNKTDLASYEKNRTKVVEVLTDYIIDTVGGSRLEVDGSWGKATTRRAQMALGTVVDGKVSNQKKSDRERLGSAHESAWEFKEKGYEKGSDLVRAIQKLVGRTGKKRTGFMDRETVKELQRFLKEKGFYDGIIGGGLKTLTVKAWQEYLNSRQK